MDNDYKLLMNSPILEALIYKFTYLGNTLSRAVNIGDEVTTQIAKAILAFDRLRGHVWNGSETRRDTKLKVYKVVLLPNISLYVQLRSTMFIDSDFCHNYLHTPGW